MRSISGSFDSGSTYQHYISGVHLHLAGKPIVAYSSIDVNPVSPVFLLTAELFRIAAPDSPEFLVDLARVKVITNSRSAANSLQVPTRMIAGIAETVTSAEQGFPFLILGCKRGLEWAFDFTPDLIIGLNPNLATRPDSL